jgi:hypothetical protein
MNIKCLFLLLIITLIGLSSCKNNDNVFAKVTYTDLTIVNASPDTLNFYLNGTRQNNSSNLYPAGNAAHLSLPSGSQDYQFKKAGNSAVLFSVPLNLTANIFYSLYLTGESAGGAFYHADTLYRDTLPNMATVRFVHAASDVGNLDVYVGDTVNFKNRSFKTTSVFLPIASGPQEVKVFQTGATIPKVDTLLTLQANTIYTLFSKGLINGKGSSAFGIGTVLN